MDVISQYRLIEQSNTRVDGLVDRFNAWSIFNLNILMAMSSDSESSANKRRERSPSENKAQASKLFITNIDGKVDIPYMQADIAETEKELRHLFEKYGVVSSLVAKRNRNS